MENSAEGAFPLPLCSLRFTRKMIRQTINPKPTTPPTTPPAMAPVSLLELEFDTGEVDELDEDPVVEVAEVDAVVLVEPPAEESD